MFKDLYTILSTTPIEGNPYFAFCCFGAVALTGLFLSYAYKESQSKKVQSPKKKSDSFGDNEPHLFI